jgi:hypothetical protein
MSGLADILTLRMKRPYNVHYGKRWRGRSVGSNRIAIKTTDCCLPAGHPAHGAKSLPLQKAACPDDAKSWSAKVRLHSGGIAVALRVGTLRRRRKWTSTGQLINSG